MHYQRGWPADIAIQLSDIVIVATHCTGASVTALAYDALDRLVQADQDGQVSHYAYDHAGRRIRKTVAGATVDYLYNGPDILAEYRSWGKADASYVHGPATDDPLLRVTAANDVSYHHADGLGSIVAHTDATSNLTAAQLYDAWGQPHPTARLGSLGQYGYTGREPDETGLMYYRARYYDPALGRFTQRDPLGMPDGVNRYAYVANSPTNFTDPTGEVRWWDATKAGVGVVSNLAGTVVGGVIMVAGSGLLAAPEPLLTKVGGVGAIAYGGVIATKSVVGVGLNINNLIDAVRDKPASSPASLAEVIAERVSPGNSNAQKIAQIADLTLDLSTGRVKPDKMMTLKNGIPGLKWGSAEDTMAAAGTSGKAFNVTNDVFQGAAAFASTTDSVKEIYGAMGTTSTRPSNSSLQEVTNATPFCLGGCMPSVMFNK